MRLDIFLFENGFCSSRSKAQSVISEKRVKVNGEVITKPSHDIHDTDKVYVEKSTQTEFVGRGGHKLEYALKTFSVTVNGKVCVDIGASTGGFTECLLNCGAACVYAIDSGTGQLADKLKNNDKVINIEGFNARNMTTEVLDGKHADIVVMDVSFISQKLLYPAIMRICRKNSEVITLIKPQFEAGRGAIGKKGIVKDDKIRKKVVSDIVAFAEEFGFEVLGVCDSPITGGDGNKEFLMYMRVK